MIMLHVKELRFLRSMAFLEQGKDHSFLKRNPGQNLKKTAKGISSVMLENEIAEENISITKIITRSNLPRRNYRTIIMRLLFVVCSCGNIT